MNIADLSILSLEASHLTSEVNFIKNLFSFSFIMLAAMLILLLIANWEK